MSVLLLGACTVPRTTSSPTTPRPTAIPRPTATPAPDPCADAVAQVQAYRAPGAREPLQTALAWHLALEAQRRPMEPVGWQEPRMISGTCAVWFHVWLGNEPVVLKWEVHPQTGAVRALDDTTRRLSGW